MDSSRARQPPPEFVNAYLQAANAGDISALVAAFADDAVVNDQLCDHRGRQAICEWARRDVIGMSLRLEVVDWVEHYGSVLVTAHADGQFDRRGLPDPLVLTLHFFPGEGRIGTLIILQNFPAEA
jgi:hypothetical protein